MKLDKVNIRTRADYARGLIEALESLPENLFLLEDSRVPLLLEAISSDSHYHFIQPLNAHASAVCIPDGALMITAAYDKTPLRVCFNYNNNKFVLHSSPLNYLAPNITPGENRPILENIAVNCPAQHAKTLVGALGKIINFPFISDYHLVIEASSNGEVNYIYPKEREYHGIVSIPMGASDVNFNPDAFDGVFSFILGGQFHEPEEYKYNLFMKRPGFLPIRNIIPTATESGKAEAAEDDK